MICPNCKTELVEVNGRYICSDCGREIPENEVMASDWGNGGGVRAGLYGAGIDEEPTDGSQPITTFDTSLTETESEPPAVEVPAQVDEPTVEEILQAQSIAEPMPADPVVDTGFYTAENNQQQTIIDQPAPVIPAQELESSPGSFVPTQDDVETTAIPVSVPVIPTTPAVIPTVVEESLSNILVAPVPDSPDAQEIPAPIPTPEPEPITPIVPEIPTMVPAESEPTPETVPEHTEIVQDMFENTEIAKAPVQDPGIYTDPLYENIENVDQHVDNQVTPNTPMPADKKLNLIVLITGSVLVLLLIVGGTWGYLALSKANQPTITPVIEEQSATWQEFAVADAGFHIDFPGTPNKTEGAQKINAVESTLTLHSVTKEKITYLVGYTTIDATNQKAITDSPEPMLSLLATEIAANSKMPLTESKYSKYYDFDSITFTISDGTAVFRGKLIISKNKYIMIMAGSSDGSEFEYDKFIKSFALTTGRTS